ncbi:ABC transporter substrate-binding protein [Shimia marina]|uniref:Glutamine-binding periplasmic protein n=1 Tax=Shimia marina TaxID=321267 RepID=A0A0P1EMK8_9RHOB|nr:ABC transporter substrate-binding protein [Shimia marina]CUH51590.1 Glutamine-binding periplasmic protein precursor [Shimia marina]SFD45235.1 amino acid ABC transporter substrate-binding protein, PAAT family [Shimia marina]
MSKHLLAATAIAALSATTAFADGHCADGKTLTDGALTIATGNPAYFPWVLDNAPESGEGFEAAVAYAVAAEMGFAAENVTWVRSSFDQAIQPGPKDFDLNLQQFSITEDREKMVDFSAPYYAAPMAILAAGSVADTDTSIAALQGLVWGAMGGTTAVPVLMETIAPSSQPLLYGDNADVTAAMQAGQIDAALFDLPTALYLSAVVVEGSKVIGQFPADRTENPDRFGMLMEEGNPLKACVDAAIDSLTETGKLAEIEAQWLQQTTGVPLIK